MILEYDIREKMAEVIRREISVSDFVRWIVSNSWNMHQDSSESAVDLSSEIHLLLAERDNFQLDDESFIDELSALTKPFNVKFVDIEEKAMPHLTVRFKTSTPPLAYSVAV